MSGPQRSGGALDGGPSTNSICTCQTVSSWPPPQAEAAKRRVFLTSLAAHQKEVSRPNAALAARRREKRTAAVHAWHAKCADARPFDASFALRLPRGFDAPLLKAMLWAGGCAADSCWRCWQHGVCGGNMSSISGGGHHASRQDDVLMGWEGRSRQTQHAVKRMNKIAARAPLHPQLVRALSPTAKEGPDVTASSIEHPASHLLLRNMLFRLLPPVST